MNISRKIKTFLEDAKASYTEKDIYLSPAFAGYLRTVSSAVTKEFALTPNDIKLLWNQKDGMVAATDNHTIYMNLNSMIFDYASTKEDRFRITMGLYCHELGHRLFTNFVVNSLFESSLKAGRWFPKEPVLDVMTCNPKLLINKADLEKYISNPDNASKLTLIMFDLLNIVEDGRIEELLYILCRKHGRLINGLNRLREIHFYEVLEKFDSVVAKINDEDNKNYTEFIGITNLILSYVKYGQFPGLTGTSTEPIYAKLASVVEYIDAAKYAVSAAQEIDQINMLMIALWPEIKDHIEKTEKMLEEQQANQAGQSSQQQSQQNLGDQGTPGSGDQQSSSGPSSSSSSGQNSSNQPSGNSGENAQSGANNNTQNSGDKKEEKGSNNEESKTGSSQKKEDETAQSNPKVSLDEVLKQLQKIMDEAVSGKTTTPQSNEKGVDENVIKEAIENASSTSKAKHILAGGTVGDSDPSECTDEEAWRIPEHASTLGPLETAGDTLYDNDYKNKENTFAKRELEKVLNIMADEAYETHSENELARSLQHDVDTLNWDDIHKGVDKIIYRPKVSESNKESYEAIAPPFVRIATETAKKVLPLFEDNPPGEMLSGKYSGTKFNANSVVKSDYKYFSKKKSPDEKPSLIVGLRVDESGSMGSNNRAIIARATAITLNEFCSQCNIPIAIYGDSTSYGRNTADNVDIFVYSDYGKQSEKDKYRLMNINHRGANRDGACIRLLGEEMLKQDADMKLMIIISDGQPNATGYHGDSAEDDLKKIVSEYTRKGIVVLAAAIGDDKDAIKRIYGADRFFDITNLNDLPKTLTMLVKRHVLIS